MIGARTAIAVAVLVGAFGARLKADDKQPPSEAIGVSCRADKCEADLPPGGWPVRLCIEAEQLGIPLAKTAPLPEIVRENEKPGRMQRDGTRWCTTITQGSSFTIRVGNRTFDVVLYAPVPAVPAPMPGGWEKLLDDPSLFHTQQVHGEPLDDEARHRLLDALVHQTEFNNLVGPGEPVPTSPSVDPSLPDDLAFLDVVAVGDDSSIHCTGIAVTVDAVLTAAHCVPATHVDLAVHTLDVIRTARVRGTIVHPSLDVAVLRLATPLPVKIRPRRHAADVDAPRGVLRAVGFGVDDPATGSGFGIKRRADFSVSSWGCDAGRSVSTGCRGDAEMVIAGIAGRDTCWGDSGGPVLEPFGETWRLVAITSRPTLHGSSACGHGGIYERVDAIDAWLTQALEEKR